ncbi:MAG TPA: hypothetical protein VFG51_01675 [Candidatus Saccharimonadia bacterium]|nr:hypothetical protein [Candidatus Saccharimonadia bacterium]
MVGKDRPIDYAATIVEQSDPEQRAHLLLAISVDGQTWNIVLNYICAHLRAQELQQMLPFIPEENRDLIFKLANRID